MTLSDGPVTLTKGDHSRSIWIRIWDNNSTGKLLIEGRVSPANGKVIFDYLTAGSTNEGGTKNHRFNQTVTKEASIRELLQQNTLLSWDVLLFALIALPGIRDLGVESHGGKPRGKHLVKLHVGYTELKPGHWHHFHRTHLPCAWHEEGEAELTETLEVCIRIHNTVKLRDSDDELKRDTARFHNITPFGRRTIQIRKEQGNTAWHHLDDIEDKIASAECHPQQSRSINGPPIQIQANRACTKRPLDETTPKSRITPTSSKTRKISTDHNLVCEARRFAGILLDSVDILTALTPEEIGGNPEYTKKGLTELLNPELEEFFSLLTDIARDSLLFLPPAEKPPIVDLTAPEDEYFNFDHFGNPESPKNTGENISCPEPSIHEVQTKAQYPENRLSTPAKELRTEPLSPCLSDTTSISSTDLFFERQAEPTLE